MFLILSQVSPPYTHTENPTPYKFPKDMCREDMSSYCYLFIIIIIIEFGLQMVQWKP